MSATIIDIVQHKVLELNLANFGDDSFTQHVVYELEKGIDEATMLSRMRELLAEVMHEGLIEEFVRFLYHDAQLQAAQHGTQQQQQQPPPSPPTTQTSPAEASSTNSERMEEDDDADRWRVFEEALTSDYNELSATWDLTASAPTAHEVVSYIVKRFQSGENIGRPALTSELVKQFFAAHVTEDKVKFFVGKRVFLRHRERIEARGTRIRLGEEGVVSFDPWTDCDVCQRKRLLNCDLRQRVKRHEVTGIVKDIDAAIGIMAPCSNCRHYGGPKCICRLSGISTAAAMRFQAEDNWLRYTKPYLPDPALGPPSKMLNVSPDWVGQAISAAPRLPARIQLDPRRTLPLLEGGSKSKARTQAFHDGDRSFQPPGSTKPKPSSTSIPVTGQAVRVSTGLPIVPPGMKANLTMTLENHSSKPVSIAPQVAAMKQMAGGSEVRVSHNPNKAARVNKSARRPASEVAKFAPMPNRAAAPQLGSSSATDTSERSGVDGKKRALEEADDKSGSSSDEDTDQPLADEEF